MSRSASSSSSTAAPAASSGGIQLWSSATSKAQFCPRCGTLLAFFDNGEVSCDKCDYNCAIQDLPTLSVVTHSHPKPEPEWLTEHKAAVAAAAGRADASAGGKAKKPARATVNEECPSCKAPFMEFYAMQLRSADEGQTVFYECVNVKCGHKFSVNT